MAHIYYDLQLAGFPWALIRGVQEPYSILSNVFSLTLGDISWFSNEYNIWKKIHYFKTHIVKYYIKFLLYIEMSIKISEGRKKKSKTTERKFDEFGKNWARKWYDRL